MTIETVLDIVEIETHTDPDFPDYPVYTLWTHRGMAEHETKTGLTSHELRALADWVDKNVK